MPFEWKDDPSTPPIAPGSVVLSSFPSAGLAATIAAHYIVQTLKLPRVGQFNAEGIPPIAVIQSGLVNPAVRVYGRPGLSLVMSDFPPLMSSVGPMARAILDGAETRGASAIIGLEGVMPVTGAEEESEPPASAVWAVTSHPQDPLLKRLTGAGARPLEDGVLGGVSGALLVGGLTRKIPVAVLLVSATAAEGFPDNRAGAALIEVLDRVFPEIAIDTKPLRTQAEIIERALRAAMKARAREERGGDRPTPEPPAPSIYQ
ncbi:MAG TPA: PAC2 family protein [Thermoplasmata archaeon]|nr:PAC2 family protein [Thermoplasmata archaeon]